MSGYRSLAPGVRKIKDSLRNEGGQHDQGSRERRDRNIKGMLKENCPGLTEKKGC